MRPLRGLGVRPYRIEVHELAVIGGFLLGPQRLHRQHMLAHDLEAVLVRGAVILHLVDVPATTDAEHETAARQLVEAGDRLGGHDRLVLRNQADAGADLQFLRRGGGEGKRHERVVGVGIALGKLAAAWEGRLPAERNMRVFGDVKGGKAAVLQRFAQLGDIDAVVGRKVENPYIHCVSPAVTSRPIDLSRYVR